MKPTRISRRCAAASLLSTVMLTGGTASAAPHTFVLTYRDFGPVTSTSRFTRAHGYSLRFEGCFARRSDEAICGFTLRANQALMITNVANASHGTAADGATKRTCCMFVQGDGRGYPITAEAAPPPGVARLGRTVPAGQALAVMLRVPDFRNGGHLTAITFSRGAGDPGASFPAHVEELP